jgi:hypothetical protein
MGRFAHSHDHALAKQIVEKLAKFPNVAEEALVTENEYAELGAFLSRDSAWFLRCSDAAQRGVSKRLLRRITAMGTLGAGPPDWFGRFGRRKLAQFQRHGCVEFGQLITRATCDRIRRALAEHPVYNAHIAGVGDGVPRFIGDPQDPAERYQFGAYAEDVIASIPEVRAIAEDDRLLRFLAAFFQSPPVLRDFHLWWSFPSSDRFGPAPHAGQQFHRDYRALQDVQFFVCLKDMPGEDGAHHYLCGTHDEGAYAALTGVADRDAIQTVFYPPGDGYGQDDVWIGRHRQQAFIPVRAGRAFAIDAMGLHRGIPPKQEPRLIMSARFSASGAEAALVEARASGRRFGLRDFAFHSYDLKVPPKGNATPKPAESSYTPSLNKPFAAAGIDN